MKLKDRIKRVEHIEKEASTKWKHMPLTAERVKDFIARGIHNPEKYVKGLQKGFDEVTRKRGIEVARLSTKQLESSIPQIRYSGGYMSVGLDPEKVVLLRGKPRKLLEILTPGEAPTKKGLKALDAVASRHELGEAMSFVRQGHNRLKYDSATKTLSGSVPYSTLVTDGVGAHQSPRILMEEARHSLLSGKHKEVSALTAVREKDSFTDGLNGIDIDGIPMLEGLAKTINSRRPGGGTSEYSALRALGWKEGDPVPRGRKLKKMMRKYEGWNKDYTDASNALIAKNDSVAVADMGELHMGAATLIKKAYIENVYPAIMKTPVTQRLIEKKLTGLIKQEAQRRLMENVPGYSGEMVGYRGADEGGFDEPIPVDGRQQDHRIDRG